MSHMVEYERYLPEVLGEIQDCPDPIALNEIRNTIIDFCKVTTVWRVELDPITVQIAVNSHDVDIDKFIRGVGINWAYLVKSNGDEIRLNATSEDELDSGKVPLWRTKDGQPSVIFLQDPLTIRLALTPKEAYTLYVGMWVMPSRDSYEAPAFIYDKYLEAIACGAKARILKMKGRPWYSPVAAMEEMKDYESKRKSATIDAQKSHTRVSKSVSMRPLA
jgi:hypothetical protein